MRNSALRRNPASAGSQVRTRGPVGNQFSPYSPDMSLVGDSSSATSAPSRPAGHRGGVQHEQLIGLVGGQLQAGDRVRQVVEDPVEEGDVEPARIQRGEVVQVADLEPDAVTGLRTMRGQEPGLPDPVLPGVEPEALARAELPAPEQEVAAVARAVEHAASPPSPPGRLRPIRRRKPSCGRWKCTTPNSSRRLSAGASRNAAVDTSGVMSTSTCHGPRRTTSSRSSSAESARALPVKCAASP